MRGPHAPTSLPTQAANIFLSLSLINSSFLSLSSPGFCLFISFFLRVSREGLDGSAEPRRPTTTNRPPPPLAWRRPLGRKLPLVLFVLACLLSCVVVVVAWSPGHGVTIQHSEEMTWHSTNLGNRSEPGSVARQKWIWATAVSVGSFSYRFRYPWLKLTIFCCGQTDRQATAPRDLTTMAHLTSVYTVTLSRPWQPGWCESRGEMSCVTKFCLMISHLCESGVEPVS